MLKSSLIKKTIYWTLLVVPLFVSADTIPNPLGNVGTFAELVTNLANAVIEIAIPFVVVFLMYAGFLFVSARGNEKNLTHAKEVFYWTIVGAAVVVGAGALAKASVHFVQSLGGDTSGNQPSGYAGQTSGGPADEQPGSFPGQTSGNGSDSGGSLGSQSKSCGSICELYVLNNVAGTLKWTKASTGGQITKSKCDLLGNDLITAPPSYGIPPPTDYKCVPSDEQPGSFPGQTSGSPNNSGTTNTTTLTDAEINAMIQEQLLRIDSRIATAPNPASASTATERLREQRVIELLQEQRAIISRLGRDIIIKCGNISNWVLHTDNGVETINCQ